MKTTLETGRQINFELFRETAALFTRQYPSQDKKHHKYRMKENINVSLL